MADGSWRAPGLVRSPARWTVFVRRWPRIFFIFFYFRLIGFISLLCFRPPPASLPADLLFGQDGGAHALETNVPSNHPSRLFILGRVHVTMLPLPQVWSGSSISR